MKPEFYIGTSGWSYNHWKGIFYPENLPQKRWLSFYSGSFNTVEVNMTFYRFPRESAVLNWGERTRGDFLFTFKAPKVITHVRRLVDIEKPLCRFYDLLDMLGNKGRSVLFQMPPSFHLSAENMKRVEHLLGLLDDKYDHAIEFRDKSWWCREADELLRGRCGFCSVNGLDMPGDIVAAVDSIYMRFHGGHYNLLYGEDELKVYAGRLFRAACENGIKRVYIYFNNDYNGYAVKNALAMRNLLDAMVQPITLI